MYMLVSFGYSFVLRLDDLMIKMDMIPREGANMRNDNNNNVKFNKINLVR